MREKHENRIRDNHTSINDALGENKNKRCGGRSP